MPATAYPDRLPSRLGPGSVARAVLVVDDDEYFRYLVRQILEPAGFKIIEAENVQQGLNMVRTRLVDAILLDIVMPDRDGFEALPELRNAAPNVKIVTVSGSLSSDIYLKISAHLGADASLDKSDIGLLGPLLNRMLQF